MKKKILIIDDDEAILDAISALLDTFGYLVDAISKGEEASKKISQFQPDLILLDVLLADIDGRSICKALKSNLSTKSIPVVMISAHPDAKQTSLKSGANDFLAKPFELDQLLEKISKNLN